MCTQVILNGKVYDVTEARSAWRAHMYALQRAHALRRF
jgi:hypothetical protein